MSICKTIETISTTSTKFSYGYYKQTINCVIKTLIVNEWIQTRRTKDMSMNVNTTATTYGNYQNNYQTSGTDKRNETTKSTKTTETKKSSVESLGEKNLSRAAQKVLKDLRGSRNDMDFYVADFENGDNAKDILSRSDKEFTVIFSKEEMEKWHQTPSIMPKKCIAFKVLCVCQKKLTHSLDLNEHSEKQLKLETA